MRKMNSRLRVAVLMGGPSVEHAVSLHTGEMVLKGLSRKKYQPSPVIISKKGKWPLLPEEFKKSFDVAFIAMHGEYGEDGTVQALLQGMKMPFIGSGAAASRLGMDKDASSKRFKRVGLSIPPYIMVQKGTTLEGVAPPFGIPAVVKPNDRGSSIGIRIVKEKRRLIPALKYAFNYSDRVMVQQYIKGMEVTCGVVEIKSVLTPLPPIEIIANKDEFYDYASKYSQGGSDHIIPARLPRAMLKKIQALALKAHRTIGAKGLSRTDAIVSSDNRVWVLEINTLPGLTATSLLPDSAKSAGISFSRLLDDLIESARVSR